jgi:hypothetical protein
MGKPWSDAGHSVIARTELKLCGCGGEWFINIRLSKHFGAQIAARARPNGEMSFRNAQDIPSNGWGVLKKSLGSFVEAYNRMVLRACVANDLEASNKIARSGASDSAQLH